MRRMKIFGVGAVKALLLAAAGYILFRAYGSKVGGVTKPLDDVASKLPGSGVA